MKTIIIIVCCFAAAVVICYCFLSDRDKDITAFIPGTYWAERSNEFSEAKDTIAIALSPSSATYRYYITRRTAVFYTAIERQPEYRIEQWTGFYNKDHQTLIVQKSGRELSFHPGKKEMVMGITIYKKL